MSERNQNRRLFRIGGFSPSRWSRTLAVFVVILLVAVLWASMRQIPSGPRYRGKALALWLRTYAPSSSNALWALGDIHAEPRLCVPVLTRALGDSDQWAQLSAAHALGMFGTNARLSVLSLRELTNASLVFKGPVMSMGVQVRLEALKALRKIEFPVSSPSSDPPLDLEFPP